VNPSTENFDGLELPAGVRTIPIVTLGDGTQIWKITHNGVDSHPIHFHFSDVQLINRVGWDGLIRPPEASELGWQETVRVSPLEDTFVAMRPLLPQTPFGIPVSKRPLNPALPIGSAQDFVSLDPLGNAITPAYTNEVTDFGWEYVWHCHILSHEEMDMMRPITVKAPATLADPSVLKLSFDSAGANLAWTDPTPADAVSTWGNSKNEVGWKIMRAPIAPDKTGKLTVGTYAQVGKALANATAWTDAKGVAGAFSYKVVAWNAAGDTDSNAVGLPQAPDTPGSLTATATLNSITLGWAAPFDGGSAITKYIVELKGNGSNWSTVNSNVSAGATSLTINNLVANTTYTYRITAVNAIGSSLPGQFAAVKIPTTPAAPTNLKATAGVKSAVLTWTPPADVVGSPITKWQISWGTSGTGTGTGTVTINGSVSTTTYTVPGLTKGQKLFFRVAAVNAIGTGTSMTTTGSVTIQ
jgi:hypothetical protein